MILGRRDVLTGDAAVALLPRAASAGRIDEAIDWQEAVPPLYAFIVDQSGLAT